MSKLISIKNRAARRAAAEANRTTPKRRGRPVGSRNKPVDLPVQTKYETIEMYCRRMFISKATYYSVHAARLKLVKFGQRVLIDREFADQLAESLAITPGEDAARKAERVAP